MTQQTQNKGQEGKQKTELKSQPDQPSQPEFKDKPLNDPQSIIQKNDKFCPSADAWKPKSQQGQNPGSCVKEGSDPAKDLKEAGSDVSSTRK